MNHLTKRTFGTWAALLAVTTLPACGSREAEQRVSLDDENGQEYVPLVGGKADGLFDPNVPLEFSAACAEGDELVIAAVGDVLLHGSLQKQGLAAGTGFVSLWADAADLLARADLAYANLEGPTAHDVNKAGKQVADPGRVFDGVVYTSYPQFNYHPSLIEDLKASGVDVVSTANNHSLDRWALGVDRTIDALRQAEMAFTGTRKRFEDTPWYTVTQSRGFSLAWLACTYGTNGIPDYQDQVLYCYQDQDEIEALVQDLSQRQDLDAVIVTPHWGLEYHATPEKKEMDFAHRLLEAGALAVIGSHPHVLQPWEKYVTADGRETFVLYSLGNFVSGQRHLARRSTLLLYLSLVRQNDGSVAVSSARYVPLHMRKRNQTLPWDLQVIDRAGEPGDSRALTTGMFGLWNLHWPWQEPGENPACQESWTPPHFLDGWIGGSCEESQACGGMQCAAELPGGLCTMSCAGYCPDQAGRAVTFCVDLGLGDSGSCVARCTVDTDCREGYACQSTERFSQPWVTEWACVPVDAPAVDAPAVEAPEEEPTDQPTAAPGEELEEEPTDDPTAAPDEAPEEEPTETP